MNTQTDRQTDRHAEKHTDRQIFQHYTNTHTRFPYSVLYLIFFHLLIVVLLLMEEIGTSDYTFADFIGRLLRYDPGMYSLDGVIMLANALPYINNIAFLDISQVCLYTIFLGCISVY